MLVVNVYDCFDSKQIVCLSYCELEGLLDSNSVFDDEMIAFSDGCDLEYALECGLSYQQHMLVIHQLVHLHKHLIVMQYALNQYYSTFIFFV